MIFIAELGINHHGSIDKAKRMADKAKALGATYIKFQYYNPTAVLGAQHPDLQYAKQCQFSRQQHETLRNYIGDKYMVSVFHVGDIGWADTLCKAHKIASRMNKNQEFISLIERCKKPTFMSIQPEMSTHIPDRFQLMWCIREYPSFKSDILQYPYKYFGLSSHCPDWEASAKAIELGARVVENHLCESKEELGCDISSSLTFEEYGDLIASANQICGK